MTPPLDADQPRRVRIAGHAFSVVDDKPTFWARAQAGAWEREALEAIAALCRPGVVFLDIGAWVGPTALFAAACGASVTAIEADPRALELLRDNVAANPGLMDRIAVLAGAAAPMAGTVRIAAPRKPGDSMTSVLVAGTPHVFDVQALTPADIVGSLPEDRTGLVVKIDIEGGEYALLPALAAMLPEDTEALLVAFHPRLLAGSGRSASDVEAATRACFEALAAFEVRAIGTAGRADPLAAAQKDNVTLRFSRHPDQTRQEPS
jgi:FkbM family methyltransferase